jgi:hypothetical protein
MSGYIWDQEIGETAVTFDLHSASASEAKSYVRDNVHDGVRCPCCEQYAKVYRRKLNSNMGRFLISLIQRSDVSVNDGWVHYSQCKFRGRDYSYLDVSYFDLASQRPNDDTGKRSSGFWRPTRRGVNFANNNLAVPKYIHVYNGSLLDFSPDLVNIVTCLGSDFSYEELMEEGVEV